LELAGLVRFRNGCAGEGLARRVANLETLEAMRVGIFFVYPLYIQETGMGSGRRAQLLKQAGEYLVAAELCRRGFTATTFTGAMPWFDILAAHENGVGFPVQVKAIAGSAWQLRITRYCDVEVDAGKQELLGKVMLPHPDMLCVFVQIAEYGRDRFYVLKHCEFQDVVFDHYDRYLKRHGGRRPQAPESLHCAIRPPELKRFEDAWDRFHEAGVERFGQATNAGVRHQG
jgi:hypothetical protein